MMLEKATKNNNYHYNKSLKVVAQQLRNNSTKAEIHLWDELLKNKQFEGYSFFRQRPILNYIVDFVCFELMLIVELDGEVHDFQAIIERDKTRDTALEAIGFKVIRFSNWLVFNRLDEIVAELNLSKIARTTV